MTYRANTRREAIRQLAELRTRLDAAEGALTAAAPRSSRRTPGSMPPTTRWPRPKTRCTPPMPTASKRGGTATPARQAHERASAVVERLQRRVSELTDRLAQMP